MSKYEKALKRLSECPKDYRYSEAAALLVMLGYKESNKGKSSGSRVAFYRESDKSIILLHKPHPGSEMLPAAVRHLYKFLKEGGDLDE